MNQAEFVIAELEKIATEHGDLYLIMQDFDGNKEFVSDIDVWAYVKYKRGTDIYNPIFDSLEREVVSSNQFSLIKRLKDNGHTVVNIGDCANFKSDYKTDNKGSRLRISEAIKKLVAFSENGIIELSTGGSDEFFEEVETAYYYILKSDWYEYNRLDVSVCPDEYLEGCYEDGKRGIEKGKCVYIR